MSILRSIWRWAALSWFAIVAVFLIQVAFALTNHPIGAFGTRQHGCVFEKFEYQCRGFAGAETAQAVLAFPTFVAVGGVGILVVVAHDPSGVIDVYRQSRTTAPTLLVWLCGAWALAALSYVVFAAFNAVRRKVTDSE